jgi:hypothetical protein
LLKEILEVKKILVENSFGQKNSPALLRALRRAEALWGHG